jgi:multicomponent K+:H+ antiporter subunit G
MSLAAEFLASLLILVGAFFLLVGSYGLAVLPDLMRRLHGPTKATTLGVGATLIASMLYFGLVRGEPSIHELLIAIFLFVTAPVSAQMIAKAHLLTTARADLDLPEPDGEGGWATLGDEAAGEPARAAD